MVLNVTCVDKVDIKKVFRLGKPPIEDKQRSLLIEFRDTAIKNKVLENLPKLRDANEQLRQISVTHDMTEGEREQCREGVHIMCILSSVVSPAYSNSSAGTSFGPALFPLAIF